MEKYSWDYFDTVFGIEGVRSTLGGPIEDTKGRLEITLNHPRNKSFLKMNTMLQKAMYSILFMDIVKYLDRINPKLVYSYKYEYEFSQDGEVHLHGYVNVNFGPFKINIFGFVEQVARYVCSLFPVGINRVNAFDYNKMHPLFPKYTCPCCCIKFNFDTANEYANWDKYITKNSLSENI